jgi:N-methylhydantoinase A/oxoprolinase/acetone carboxylase beta subunit
MQLAIGIDAGGTYTDAVLIDYAQGSIVAVAKALTTKHDLAIGIHEALRAVLAHAGDEIHLVSLSTTLATNAIVEGQGAPVCALLIGYEQALRPELDIAGALGVERYALIGGGHTMDGEERVPLDLAGARSAILAHAPHVRALAISSYFATRNPAHELAVQELVRELTDLPSTCGHELTQQLDALRRATTVILNASLIPLLQELIHSVQGALAALGVAAPLMLVKGDGSLMEAGVAARKPIETILSGPAASVIGACHLSGSQSIVAADMGGTTTDIALVEGGQPVLKTQGAQVGAWRTMIEAIDIHTVGLGGDSHVRLAGGALTVGPRRALPLCLLAQRHPQVADELARLAGQPGATPAELEFLALQRDAPLADGEHPPFEAELYAALRQGPLTMRAWQEIVRFPSLYERYLARLERQGIVIRAGLTPTDAAHVLGCYVAWNREAAGHAASVAARSLGLAPEELCRRIMEQASARIAQEIVAKLWAQDGNGSPERLSPGALARLVSANGSDRLHFRPRVAPLLVGLGAPAASYFPRVADLLDARLEVPSCSGVANALGAVVGSVVARVQALVLPQEHDQGYLVHLPQGSRSFAELEQALAYGRTQAERLAQSQATEAGASEVRVVLQEDHSHAPVSDSYGGQVYVQSRINARAVGRPRLKIHTDGC